MAWLLSFAIWVVFVLAWSAYVLGFYHPSLDAVGGLVLAVGVMSSATAMRAWR